MCASTIFMCSKSRGSEAEQIMIKELYQENVKEVSINLSQTRVESVRKKSITKSCCRIYKDGVLGIAGALGEPTKALWKAAESNLALGLPYPFAPETNLCRSRDLRKSTLDAGSYVAFAEQFAENLRREYPQLMFSNKMYMQETAYRLTNDAGLNYESLDNTFGFGFMIKAADSSSIMDTEIVLFVRTLNMESLMSDICASMDAFLNPVPLPAGDKLPIVITSDSPLLVGKLEEALNGEMVGRGTSLLGSRMGRKVFHDSVTVYQDRSEEMEGIPFFDLEGNTYEGDRCPLIRNGVVLRPYTDKKTAADFHMELTGAAGGGYDAVPTLTAPALILAPGQKTLKELLGGRPALQIEIASGGDYTDEGLFASPVQMSYLTDGVRPIGKLPEFSVSGNLFDMLGGDFIGVSSDTPLSGRHAAVINMKIN
ncbi:peptidase U62 [Lachnotalea sp. AF33-28]|nr:peptidase U62 [Lachnotalea sp. AF33-28]